MVGFIIFETPKVISLSRNLVTFSWVSVAANTHHLPPVYIGIDLVSEKHIASKYGSYILLKTPNICYGAFWSWELSVNAIAIVFFFFLLLELVIWAIVSNI